MIAIDLLFVESLSKERGEAVVAPAVYRDAVASHSSHIVAFLLSTSKSLFYFNKPVKSQ